MVKTYVKMDSIKGIDSGKIFTHTWIRNYCSKIPPYIYLQEGFLFIHFENKQACAHFTNLFSCLYHLNIIIYRYKHIIGIRHMLIKLRKVTTPKRENVQIQVILLILSY